MAAPSGSLPVGRYLGALAGILVILYALVFFTGDSSTPKLGLDRLDRAVLDALVRRFGGGPVGVATLAVAVGEEQRTVEEVAEPYLVRAGLLARTPRGRVATRTAWAHLGLRPPPGPGTPLPFE